MKTSDFEYRLPERLIAQKSASPREAARLMLLDRLKDRLEHRRVRDLPELLRTGDVLVVNVSKVFNARLRGTVPGGGPSPVRVEIFLVRPEGRFWRALGKPGRKLVPGTRVAVAKGFLAHVLKKDEDGSLLVDFGLPKDEVIALANRHGEIPVPPYVKRLPRSPAAYQTVYAKAEGSVAAPTAGFHLTKALIARLKRKGVEFLEVTLHVGLGTFQPIRGTSLAEHRMHAEWVEIPKETVRGILQAKIEKRRVVAVGTTAVRALEGAVERCGGELCPWHGDVDLFIRPGFRFRIVDALITNFHLPKSTLLVLVSAFAGRERILKAYREAVKKRYRFYSFGDAMLIL
jgi:S-adenosylmethionine:tRNA ribosyltransferase-isomerase